MTMFWLATLALILLSAVFLFWPLIQKKEFDDEARRDELNKAFYKDRLEELEEETSEGLVDDQQELIADLKQTLLDDIPAQQEHRGLSDVPKWLIGFSLITLVMVSYGLYAKFGSLDKVQDWHEVSANLPALTKKLMSPTQEALTEDEMQDLTLALRTRLHHEPDDSTGWLLLGRIALANRDATTAVGAMKKAYKIEPQDADIQLGYAQALMLSSDEIDQENARRILMGLLKTNHMDLRVFSLLAFDAFERQEYAAAIRYWSAMQKLITPEDSRYVMLERSIENARQKLSPKEADATRSVSVTINLGDQIDVDPNAVLIVSVHRADGSPMPVAAARYPLGIFPRTVVLDDGNSMMQGVNLTSLSELMVRARIDRDGNVATRDGDWYGESDVAKLGEPVALTIDKRY
ncbi:c-type cytochrome biogenesis protein CcmI [Vibrio sp. SCSIO 43136]|uniref:c-type cytochrome biogenesis protein CcmI n=1 Tax=Vibrio sp. SCSIO 43136 TaxID=2819101 RepID=UPI002075FDB9|nr:c-type cytochrome biogenesis protein CcmI [Vibrio sp. SCSIO 43136]USD66007.1 c-type cytochrome biogenesis protein CcmI [Vibrio sp. SCSIO 43136]